MSTNKQDILRIFVAQRRINYVCSFALKEFIMHCERSSNYKNNSFFK